jgi:hypothetical protein
MLRDVRAQFAVIFLLAVLGSPVLAESLRLLPIAPFDRAPSAEEAASAEDRVTDANYCSTCNNYSQAPGFQFAVLRKQLPTSPTPALHVASSASSGSPSDRAMQLMRAIIGEAFQNRVISPTKISWLIKKKGMHLDPHKTYRPWDIWGKEKSFTESKGWCSMAVQAALAKIGIVLGHGDAHLQVDHLAHTRGLVRTNLRDAPGGSVVACRGTGDGLGHIEIIVTNSKGQRLFCSDFCTTEQICGKSIGYGPANVFKLEGT